MGQGRIVLRLVGSGLVMLGRCGIWYPVWLVGLGEGTAHKLYGSDKLYFRLVRYVGCIVCSVATVLVASGRVSSCVDGMSW